jgi:V-type H+-transporting ATPase subunit a
MRSSDQRQTVLLTLAGHLHGWLVKVKKVKAIYYVMNMMTREGQNFVGECWVPVADMGTVQMVLNKASVSIACCCATVGLNLLLCFWTLDHS